MLVVLGKALVVLGLHFGHLQAVLLLLHLEQLLFVVLPVPLEQLEMVLGWQFGLWRSACLSSEANQTNIS